MAATRLRQPAAHHVADAEDHDVQPCLIGLEIVAMPVGRLDEVRREQHCDGGAEKDDEFRCLVESLCLAAAAGGHPSGLRVCSQSVGVRCVGPTGCSGIGCSHSVLLLMRSKYVSTAYLGCAT